MILEEATHEAFGYWSSTLTHGSDKPIKAACDECGKVRMTSKHQYRALCNSCALKGTKNHLGCQHTEEWKTQRSAAMKGNTYCLGYKHSEEFKRKLSVRMKGKHYARGCTFSHTEEFKRKLSVRMKGANHWNFKGGLKLANARHTSRRRELGYTLLMPLTDGEVGHHITDKYVIGIPKEIHQSFGGRSRKKHRTLVLQWLKANDKKKYVKVLCVLAKQ